jgi:hypothetical protein
MMVLRVRPRERAARRNGVSSSLAACAALALAWGCGEAADEDELPLEPAYVIGIRPAPGAMICEGQDVIVVFNRDPGLARAGGARLDPAHQSGPVRTFRSEGSSTVSFAWGDDEQLAVEYTALICHPEPPTLEAVTPREGASVTVPELEANGIVLDFNQPVDPANSVFHIADEDGDTWDLTVATDGSRLTLRAPPGVVQPGRAYTVRGVVTDLGGNETEIWLTYVIADAEA